MEGEEDSPLYEEVTCPIDVTNLDTHFISEDLLMQSFEERKERVEAFFDKDEINIDDPLHFNPEDAIVWIDPLDGTRDFAKGNMRVVTTIIGLAVKGRAVAGIVHKPVYDHDTAKGETFFGSLETGVFKVFYDD